MRLVTDEGALPNMTLWIDPGKTTGYAYLTDKHKFHSGQEDFMMFCTQLELSCSVYGPALWLGWEDFIITPRTAAMHGSEFALEVIGVARYLATKYDCEILNPCPPSGRELGSLQKLKRIGWYTPGRGHANDASSHLLACLLREKWLPPELLQKVLISDNETHEAS